MSKRPKKPGKKLLPVSGEKQEWMCCYCGLKRIGFHHGRIGCFRTMRCPICRQDMEHMRIV